MLTHLMVQTTTKHLFNLPAAVKSVIAMQIQQPIDRAALSSVMIEVPARRMQLTLIMLVAHLLQPTRMQTRL